MLTTSFDDEEATRGPADRRIDPQRDLQRDRARLGVLAEVSRLLASSDDYLAILDRITSLATPRLGDWCSVHLADGSGELERVAIGLAPGGAAEPDHALILRTAARVSSRSSSDWTDRVVSVPLLARARVIGVMTLGRDHGEPYDADDIAFAEELARRVAMFVDHAILLRDARDREAALFELTGALEKAHHDLDQIAYVTSHDLRAPLRGIGNLSQWVEEDLGDRLTDTSREYLHLLRRRVRRLEDLLQGVLDYSRAGRVADAPAEVDVGRLVREVVARVGGPEDAVFEIAPNLPTLRTTRVPMQQVFMNLVSNALRYNPKATPRVHVGAEPILDGWEFYVRDNGPGIAARYHAQIWGLFQTLHSRDRIESSGVGLAIVRRIVEAHGGRTWLDSEEGKGSTFRFTWPKDPPRSRSWDRHQRQR